MLFYLPTYNIMSNKHYNYRLSVAINKTQVQASKNNFFFK